MFYYGWVEDLLNMLKQVYGLLALHEMRLLVWENKKCSKIYLKDLEDSLAFLLFMLSDHLFHLRSNMKEIVVNPHTDFNMLNIVRAECERLVRCGNAIIVLVGRIDWEIDGRKWLPFGWIDAWMSTNYWKKCG
jgi:hypothetical protein